MKVTTRSEEIYFSAPSSPSNLSDQCYDTVIDDFYGGRSSVPFGWEEKPGTPKSPSNNGDFEFAFSVGKLGSETVSLSAEELFHGGVIKPLKPPPCLQVLPPSKRMKEFTHKKTTATSLPQLLLTRKVIHSALSPRYKNKESVDPFEIAAWKATKSEVRDARGREQSLNFQKSSSRKASRSLSPCRVTKYAWEDNEKWQQLDSVRMSSPSSSLCSESHKKWRLKDLFLFRSTSKGLAAGEDNSESYMATFRRWSFRDTRLGSRRDDEPDSVHTMSRSVSEDFVDKKKFLPYNHGIVSALARCGFNFTSK
ncbi:uncharacterized protein LOC142554286 [Primulina tabacum]|uniref:uncharacterized protein LOC142554286 n=1 Tax=Primulina tabacum TaxID=48773 RepID=UPI003F59B97C